MNSTGADGRSPAHLEVILCSSEDKHFPAANLARECYALQGPREADRGPVADYTPSSAGWESEKFCEYPQELVFRVNRGLPTRIDQVNLLAHHCKVATRIEIFTAPTSDDGKHPGGNGVPFQRLGFVCFQSNETTQFDARELQAVTFPRSVAKVTLLRLVLHTCHQTKANLFSQVGLVSVAVFGPQVSGSLTLPPLPSAIVVPPKEVGHLFSPLLSSLRAKYELTESFGSPTPEMIRKRDSASLQGYNVSPFPRGTDEKSPLAFAVWIASTREHKTVEQICAQIQIGKQLALFTDDTNLVQPWITLDREASYLTSLLERRTQAPVYAAESIATMSLHDSGDGGLDVLIPHFVDLERRRRLQEAKMHQQMLSPPGSHMPHTYRESASSRLPKHSTACGFESLGPEQWQEREVILWQLVASVQSGTHGGSNSRERDPKGRIPTAKDEDLVEILIVGLGDGHRQVFIAACALLQGLLATLPRLQNPSVSKSDITRILELLVARLDDRETPVRNKAIYSILKTAGSARARGTFVTHLLFQYVERKNFRPSDQRLLAFLKLFSALLQSFHCCANIDIAPKRVIHFLQLSEADFHDNALVREAAKQLALILCSEVGPSFVLEHYVSKLPEDLQRRYVLLFQQAEGQKRRPLTPDATGSGS